VDQSVGVRAVAGQQATRDGRVDAQLVQLDAVRWEFRQVLAARGEDEHEQREQHGYAGRVDEEEEFLLEEMIELRLGHLMREAIRAH
jgi:hypothetical protein